MADQQLNIKLNAIDNTAKAFSSVKTSIFSVRNALLTIASSVVVNQIVNITKEFEQLRTTLRFVTGSIEQGKNAFNLLRDLSKKTEFSTAELSNSFITLQNAGINPTKELLMTFADTASVTANSLDTLNDLTRLFAKGATGAGIGAQSLSQLAGKGIPVFQILEKELGLSRDAIKSFAENAEGSAIILDALERGLAKTFGGASSKRAEDLGKVKNFYLKI
jgi:phage tail tape-measure protein